MLRRFIVYYFVRLQGSSVSRTVFACCRCRHVKKGYFYVLLNSLFQWILKLKKTTNSSWSLFFVAFCSCRYLVYTRWWLQVLYIYIEFFSRILRIHCICFVLFFFPFLLLFVFPFFFPFFLHFFPFITFILLLCFFGLCWFAFCFFPFYFAFFSFFFKFVDS